MQEKVDKEILKVQENQENTKKLMIENQEKHNKVDKKIDEM